MRAFQAFLYDEAEQPITARIEGPVKLTEEANKQSAYELTIWVDPETSGGTALWKGSDIILKVGATPFLTRRDCVIGAREREYGQKEIRIGLTLKCRGHRMASTNEDRIFEEMTPEAIIKEVVAGYRGMSVQIKATDNIDVPITKHQHADDWSFLQELATICGADVWVRNTTVFVVDRAEKLHAKPIRQYVAGVHRFMFRPTEVKDGRPHAKATNKGVITYDPLTNTVWADGKKVDPGLGIQEFYSEDDDTGVVKTPVQNGTLATQAGEIEAGKGYAGKKGQFDAGKEAPSWESDPKHAEARGKVERRAYRDYVMKGELEYDEYDPTGTPVVGTKIELTNCDKAADGPYYVAGRRIDYIPGHHVVLVLSRSATNQTKAGKKTKPTMDPALEAAIAQALAEVQASVNKPATPADSSPPSDPYEEEFDFGWGD